MTEIRRAACSGRRARGAPGARPGSEPEDQGVSTIFACLSVVLMMGVTVLAIRLGGAMLARQQAEGAADLGALAAAAGILAGAGAACATAGEVVTANRASMTSCHVQDLDVLVEVQVPVVAWGGMVSAHARAGPVTTP